MSNIANDLEWITALEMPRFEWISVLAEVMAVKMYNMKLYSNKQIILFKNNTFA